MFFFQEDLQTNAQATVQAFASNSERLLILFDEILTADEIVRTSNDEKLSKISLIRRCFSFVFRITTEKI